MDTTTLIIISLLFVVISFLYSSVGFGGGSSYLAILSLFITDFNTIRTHALLCNIAVVSIGCVVAYLKGFLSLKKAIPYVIFSVPAALLGATFKLSERTFFIILGGALVLSAIALFLQVVRPVKPLTDTKKILIRSVPLGTGLGFLSGIVGIGGGIFLSPVLNLLNWEEAKNIAGIASFFILVNSIGGIAGLAISGSIMVAMPFTLWVVAAVIVGGFAGSLISMKLFNALLIKRLTAVLILIVGIKLLTEHF
ncbi:sulfite exporter TauE/SafE family protein [Ferruginibacter sp.]|uniref:sulfite exporter TauE/SafE family protein n=1 Tax=Ferruginibacter sp. TaxID=1940288 RepID=UPI0019A7948F|nr:sulfite exporter TauE/SafE family protein [Ferruginibacter sp.]MBC7626542.1 sulfite exporter TauE/SafE family protein [Ferruginibacter sp.]